MKKQGNSFEISPPKIEFKTEEKAKNLLSGKDKFLDNPLSHSTLISDCVPGKSEEDFEDLGMEIEAIKSCQNLAKSQIGNSDNIKFGLKKPNKHKILKDS